MQAFKMWNLDFQWCLKKKISSQQTTEDTSSVQTQPLQHKFEISRL